MEEDGRGRRIERAIAAPRERWCSGSRLGRREAFIDLADVKEVNALFAELFPIGARPARTIYQAAKLPFGGRIKVQAIAARG